MIILHKFNCKLFSDFKEDEHVTKHLCLSFIEEIKGDFNIAPAPRVDYNHQILSDFVPISSKNCRKEKLLLKNR